MKQMIFITPGKLDWAEVPNPSIGKPEHAIVKPLVMGRCDLDVLYVNGRMPMAAGEPIGHEIIGEITDLGEHAAKTFKIGQKVIVPAQISCGSCRQCLAGQTGRCQKVPLGASYGMGREGQFGGAVADAVLVPFAKAMLVLLPEHASLAPLMGLADMATDAWRAVGPQLEKYPGGTVLVSGGATPVIGIYAAALAKCHGASRVVYLDDNPERRQAAKAYGVETAATFEEISHPLFDIVVDAANDAHKFLQSVAACGPAAQLTSVAPPFTGVELPMLEMYYKGLTYTTGRPNCRHGHGPVLNSWACKGFNPGLVGPKLFSFDDAIEAWLDPSIYVAVTR